MNNLIASRKVVWPATAILLVLWFLPTIMHVARMAVPSLRPTPPPITKTEPPKEAVKPSPDIAITAEEQQQEEQLKPLLGVWAGQELLTKRGICGLTFVLKEDPGKPGHYDGNTTGNCIYSPAAVGLEKPRSVAEMMSFMAPTSAILSGTADKGVLHFNVDKVFGDRCPPATFTFTPFAAQLAAEFTDACGGGHIMLNRKVQ